MNTNIEAMNNVWMTQVGYENLLAKIAEKEKEYDQVRDHRQVAFELSGDGWHDNPEFNRMQQLEANLNHTLKTLTDRLESLKIIEISDLNRNTQQVEIGSIVHLRRYDLADDSEQEEVWEIRGFDETDLNQKHLAYNAPLAEKVMHLHVGDIAEEVQIGSRHFDIEVVKIFSSRQQAGLGG
ncbi:GreA/GreB family elongation factor [Acinetobacter sichuanensis]|uniref:GreA/GreB family elongation factor n=1 Tax=Acinetobacter sichuanensis TaxID=2136183 RepID=UPI00280D3C96|nr:GreA/GreB family elongation factor [Acinetobacter sichuanensis]MDQ9021830.1 GreA/GreB family elongation factor [Acinetobacter sichuanensis]